VQEQQRSRILILGHGEMGHAMEYLLGPRQTLRIWQRHTAPGTTPATLEESVPDSDFVLFCVPGTAQAELAARIAPWLRDDTLCITVAKGLDERARLPVEALAEALGAARVAVLYGPMIAEEIRAGRPAYAQCGTGQPSTYPRIATLYRGTSLRLEPARDIAGLSWAAILKNVYAMAFGMADELALGDNVRGYLAVAALQELAAIVTHLGGDAATPYRLAGLGDLIATGTSAGSHHHALGRWLVRAETEKLQGEGIHTLAMLRAAPRFDIAQFPLFALVDACVQNPNATRAGLPAFLDRQMT
jgi:glycerol-3-phosphate dehydrogenase (NAD(P)+)